MITERDVLNASCGLDDDLIPKAMAKVEICRVFMDKTPIKIKELITSNAYVNIFKSVAFTMIDLTYENRNDEEFKALRTLLKSIKQMPNDENTETDETSETKENNGQIAISITICPKKLNGMYYVIGFYAMYAPIASDESDRVDTVRFIILNDFFHVYKLNSGNIELSGSEGMTEPERKEN